MKKCLRRVTTLAALTPCAARGRNPPPPVLNGGAMAPSDQILARGSATGGQAVPAPFQA